MDAKRKRFSFIGLVLSLVLAFEVFFALDMMLSHASSNLSPVLAAIIFAAVLLGGLLLEAFSPKTMSIVFLTITGLIVLAALFFGILWYTLYRSVYPEIESDKSSVFANKRVMVIVPHQDDEQNILSGVFEQYVDYGSQVWVVYVTNGDYNVTVEQRFGEVVSAMETVGIPENNLILLGYGDSLSIDGEGIYYCDDAAVIESHSGYTTTHGTESHQAFREGREYTRENLYKDIRDVILRYMPDVIYCSDYDEHTDHQALSLMFDRAMGEILKSKPEYEPTVFKAFAYTTSYTAEQDFYQVNIASSKKDSEADFMPETNIYNWAERVRLPVAARSISRSMFSSGSYEALKEYRSQYTTKMADGIINGDKVFWQRETSSISYDLEFWTSSGDASLLNDFVLVDTDTSTYTPSLSTGTWIPDEDDTEKRIIVTFPESTALDRIVLYDNPSLTDNVLEAVLRFDDGTFIMTGPLETNGSGTDIQVNKSFVSELEIVLMETEGDSAGLTELELYPESSEAPFSFIKVMNANGDFVYDYYIDESGTEEFRLYTYGCSEDLSDYMVMCIGDGCSAIADGDIIRVKCPEGKSCTLTVMDKSGTISDSVQIRNEKTWHITLAQSFEKFIRKEFREGVINSNSWVILRELRNTLKGSNT